MRTFALPALCAVLVASAACQQRKEPVPTLTLEQWRRVRAQVLDELPTGISAIDARFGQEIVLRGYTLEPEDIAANGDFELTLYWEALADIDEDWTVFVHLDAGSTRQGLDHTPVTGGYPTYRWEEGQIIADRVSGTLEGGVVGDVAVHVGLYRGEERLPIREAGQGEDAGDDRLFVTDFSPGFEPVTASAIWTDDEITIDGRMTERIWQRSRATSRWVSPSTGEAIDGQDTWAKLLWTDTHLYIGTRARDRDVWATMQERDMNLWEEEVIEVFIDVDGSGSGYIELQLNPLNTVFDAYFEDPEDRDLEEARSFDIAGLQNAVHVQGTVNRREDRDIYWGTEIAIPWDSIPDFEGPPANDTTLRVNLYRYDRPSDEETFATAWAPVGSGSFHQPEHFGRVELSGRPANLAAPGSTENSDQADEQRDENGGEQTD